MKGMFFPLVLTIACKQDPADKDGDGPIYDDTDADTTPISACADTTSVQVSLPEGPLSGPVVVTVELRSETSEVAEVDLQWSTDGTIWRDLTVAEPTTDLNTSPIGFTHRFTWDTESDLGRVLTEGIQITAVARSATCNPWPLAQLQDVTINNSVIPDPLCGVINLTTEPTVEGAARVDFQLTHPGSLPTTVALTWTTDDLTWSTAHLLPFDCAGDGVGDGTTDLASSPEGADHCLIWNSEEDIGVDATATLRVACSVEGIEQGVLTLGPIDVRNDPAPGPGEVAITEIMAEPASAAGHYVELVNTSGHMLDLQGVLVERWRASTPRTDPADRSWTVAVADGVLLVNPGARTYIGASDDPVSAGCRVPEAVWPDTFTLRSDSWLVLSYGGQIISELDFTRDAGFTFSEGVAWGLSGDADSSTYSDAGARWCAQTSAIAGCADLLITGEQGTPGLPNDVCP